MKCFERSLIKYLGAIVVVAMGLPNLSSATIVLNIDNYGCPQPGCQTVGFQPSVGTTLQGNTNPAPVYNVYVESLDSTVQLHANGSNVDNAAGNDSGLPSILLYPESGWGWSLIDFQLDSVNKDQPIDIGGLSFTATDQSGTHFFMNTNFPWENNGGENQHYRIDALDGQLITSLRIDYVDPLAAGNLISDMHNIDVKSDVAPVPVPSAAVLLLSGLSGFGLMGRKRKVVS